MKKVRKLLIVLPLAVILLAVCYARYVEPDLLVVKKIEVETDKNIENCKVAFFTDTHFGELYDEKHMRRIVDIINGLKADVVIFGGDLLDNYARDREMLDLDYLRGELYRIESGEGKYAVFGNHDYGGGASRIYEDFMEDCGFHVLADECAFLDKYNIEIIGFDDYLLGQTKPESYDMQSDKFHLLVTHEPVVAEYIKGMGDNFVISGHTHGGQASIPYLTKKLLPAGSGQFVKGFYEAREIGAEVPVRIYVSSGIGLTRYPLRIFNIPEIVEINLIKRE